MEDLLLPHIAIKESQLSTNFQRVLLPRPVINYFSYTFEPPTLSNWPANEFLEDDGENQYLTILYGMERPRYRRHHSLPLYYIVITTQ